MNLRRILTLLGKELVHGPKNFMVIFALVIPIVLSLLVTLVFGTLFGGKARLAIVDLGSSQLTGLAQELDTLVVRQYSSESELKEAAGRGAADVGIVLPAGFDRQVASGEPVQLHIYVWGESQLKHRTILVTAIVHMLRQIAGQEPPLEIVSEVLGSGESMPWEKRLLPFVILMAVMLGGMSVPALGLVDEKQKRTLTALSVTPTVLEEIFLTKGLLGVLLGMLTGVLTLFINRAFGGHPALLLGVLLLGASLSAAFGVLLGALVKDINTIFTVIKGIGIFLYAPALIYMFPDIPQWIARLFPTYYIIQPVIDITQNNATWGEVAPEVVILIGLILALVTALELVARRAHQVEMLA